MAIRIPLESEKLCRLKLVGSSVGNNCIRMFDNSLLLNDCGGSVAPPTGDW